MSTVRLPTWRRKQDAFTTSRGVFDRKDFTMMVQASSLAVMFALAISLGATPERAAPAPTAPPVITAQAMIPPTGMDDAAKPMPMQTRMQMRFPQPARVGDLVGLPVLDDQAATLGYVRHVVRTPPDKIALIVSYSKWFGWFGWFTRPVAVPIEVVGIEGRQLVSLDMTPDQYAAAPNWQEGSAMVLPDDATIAVALARN
jgi:hypothetical protein